MANFVDYFILKFLLFRTFSYVYLFSLSPYLSPCIEIISFLTINSTLFIGIIRKTLEFLLKRERLFLYNIENECSFLIVSLDRLRIAAK